MGQPNDAPLFAVSNHHSGDGIEPPRIDGDDPNAYHSIFVALIACGQKTQSCDKLFGQPGFEASRS